VRTRQDGQLQLTPLFGEEFVGSMQGFGIFFDKAGETTPIVFNQFIRKLVSAPSVIIFFHLRPLDQPFVEPENKYSVSRLAIPNCYRLVVRHGYMDEVITPNLATLIFEKVRNHIVTRALDREGEKTAASTATAAEGSEEGNVSSRSSTTSSRLEALERAYNHKVLYITGKEQMKISEGTNIVRRFFLHIFLFIRENTRTKIASLDVPMDKVIEVGFVKDI
jgi:KUP system potassium uptake protein